MTVPSNDNSNDDSSSAPPPPPPPCPTLFEAPETAFFRATLAAHVASAKRKMALNSSATAAASSSFEPITNKRKKAPPPSLSEPISTEEEESIAAAATTTTTNGNNKRKMTRSPPAEPTTTIPAATVEKRQRWTSNQENVTNNSVVATSTTRSATKGNTTSTKITPYRDGNNSNNNNNTGVALVLPGDEDLVGSRIILLFQQLVPFHDSDDDGLALGCKYCSHKIACNLTVEYLGKCGMNRFTSHLCKSGCSETPQDVKNALTTAFKDQTRCPDRTEFLRRVMERMQEASNQGLLSPSAGGPRPRGNPRLAPTDDTLVAALPDAAAGRKIKQESLTAAAAAAAAASTRRSITKGGVTAGTRITTQRGRKSNDGSLVLPGDENLVGTRMILLFQQLIPLNSDDCEGGGTCTGGLVLGCKYCSRKIMSNVTLTCLTKGGAYRFASHFWNACSHTPQDVKNALTVAFENEHSKCPNRAEFFRRIIGRLEASSNNGNRQGQKSNQESSNVENHHSAVAGVVSSSTRTSATNKGKAAPTKITRQRENKSNGTLVLPGDEDLVGSRIIMLFQQLTPIHDSTASDCESGPSLGCTYCGWKVGGHVTLEYLSRNGMKIFINHLCKNCSQIPQDAKEAVEVAFKDQTTRCPDRTEFLRRVFERLEASKPISTKKRKSAPLSEPISTDRKRQRRISNEENVTNHFSAAAAAPVATRVAVGSARMTTQGNVARAKITPTRGNNSFSGGDGLVLPEDEPLVCSRIILLFQQLIPFHSSDSDGSGLSLGCKYCGRKLGGNVTGNITLESLTRSGMQTFTMHLCKYCSQIPQDMKKALTAAFKDQMTRCPDRTEFLRRVLSRLELSKQNFLSSSSIGKSSSRLGRNATITASTSASTSTPHATAVSRKNKDHSATVPATSRRSVTKGNEAKITLQWGNDNKGDGLVLPEDEALVCSRILLLFQQLIPINESAEKGCIDSDSDSSGLALGCKYCSRQIGSNVTLESLSRNGMNRFTSHLCKSGCSHTPQDVKKALTVAFKDQTRCPNRMEFYRRIIARLEASNKGVPSVSVVESSSQRHTTITAPTGTSASTPHTVGSRKSNVEGSVNQPAAVPAASRRPTAKGNAAATKPSPPRGINNFMDGLTLPEDESVASPRVLLIFRHIIPFDLEQAAENPSVNRRLPAVGCKHCGCKVRGALTVQTLSKNSLSPFKKHLLECQKVPKDVKDAVTVANQDLTPCPDRGAFWRRIIERLEASKHQDVLLSSASDDDEDTTVVKRLEEAATKKKNQEDESSFDC